MVFIPKTLFLAKNAIFPHKREKTGKTQKIAFFAQSRFCNGLNNNIMDRGPSLFHLYVVADLKNMSIKTK